MKSIPGRDTGRPRLLMGKVSVRRAKCSSQPLRPTYILRGGRPMNTLNQLQKKEGILNRGSLVR